MARIQLELPQDRVEELDELMEAAGLTTRKDLFNQALSLFQWALRQRQAGRTIASVDEAQHRYTELLMPGLETGARRAASAAKNAAL